VSVELFLFVTFQQLSVVLSFGSLEFWINCINVLLNIGHSSISRGEKKHKLPIYKAIFTGFFLTPFMHQFTFEIGHLRTPKWCMEKWGDRFMPLKNIGLVIPLKCQKNVGFDGNCVWANWIVMDPNENPQE